MAAANPTAQSGRRCNARGFSLIESLVTLFVVTIGLLGLAATQGVLHTADLEAYQRGQALVLINDLLDRINVNRAAAPCYAFSTAATVGPYLGDAGGGGHYAAAGCTIGSATAEAIARANADLAAWDALLLGATEQQGGGNIGAMIGARGCVSYDATSETYTIAVAWQGMVSTFQPVIGCGTGLYGAETKRRLVWTTVRMAKLL